MRLLVDLIIAAAIIALAWEKPLNERVNQLPWGDKTAPSAKVPVQMSRPQSQPQSIVAPTPVVQPTSTVAGSWMWDPSHKSPLDPPRKSPR
jgi:hypothetical protein